ncbi:Pr6Pr family membrane protein [Caulobacter sp. DWR1-3-2b1]|uniref:Pr6Pr family membrane protein n=1 Tax=Caulobacter sp. DWR1-3-2b1 TaxID=2804670 RepID=UPI003CEEE93E
MRHWRILIAALACLGPALQYGLMIHNESLASGLAKSVEFFSYFTILSNILAAVVLTAPLIAAGSVVATWAERSSTRIGVAVYLTITAAIYHTLLSGLWDPKGWRLVSDTLLHTVTPALFVIDWLARGGRGETGRATAAKALIFPALYGVWTLAHGAMSGFYPYPFLDVGKHGYLSVIVTMLVMAGGFLLIALLFTVIHQARAKLAIGRGAPISA